MNRGHFLFLGVLLSLPHCDGELRFETTAPSTDASTNVNCNEAACPVGLRCLRDRGACVACLTSSDCTGTWKVCDEDEHRCVPCMKTRDCSPNADAYECDETTRRCLRRCEATEPCVDPGETCDSSRELCLQCRLDTHCATAASGPRCDSRTGRCVQCVGNADCTSGTPICDRRDGTCVQCVDARECTSGRCNSNTRVCL